jgi:SAM-dependent methyltransferase
MDLDAHLRCPIDREKLSRAGVAEDTGAAGDGNCWAHEAAYTCTSCSLGFPLVEVAPGRLVPDLRARDVEKTVTLTFSTPSSLPPVPSYLDFFEATRARDYDGPSREEIRQRFGTKLQKEFLVHVDRLRQDVPDPVVLDLGCGSGGNKRYLESLGITRVVSVDYRAAGADLLVDVHRLPFDTGAFDLVLTTATLEHFYNPFVAFAEIARVLRPGGALLASGSFWESWHGNSCFHFTPHGLNLLCRSAGLELADLWSGWGFIPAVLTHALRPGLRWKRLGYRLQAVFDWILDLRGGERSVLRHRLSTSGSFGICARKPALR